MRTFLEKITLVGVMISLLATLTFCEKEDEPTTNDLEGKSTIELKLKGVDKTTFQVNVTMKNAKEAAYFVEKGKSTELPSEADIFSKGTSLKSSDTEFLVEATSNKEALTEGTEYTVYAVAKDAEGKFSKKASLSVTTSTVASKATIALKAIKEAKDALTFNIEPKNAIDAAYLVKEGIVDELPSAETIYSSGKVVAPDPADYVAKNLKDTTNYTVFAVAKNADNEYSEVVKLGMFSGMATFEVKTSNITHYSVDVDIIPSDNEIFYYAAAYPQATLDAAGLKTDEAIHKYVLEQIVNSGYGMPLEMILGQALRKGALEGGQIAPLKDNSDNALLVYAMDMQGHRLSSINKTNVKTKEIELIDMTFNITATEVTTSDAHIKVVPSRNDQTYNFTGFLKEQYPDAKTAQDYAEAIVAQYGGWMNYGAMLYKGTQDVKNFSVVPGKDYVVVAFAYNKGILSEPQMIEFTTPNAGDPETVSYEAVVTKKYSTRIHFDMTPSDNSTYFMSHLLASSIVNDDKIAEIKKGWEKQLEELLKMQQGFNPGYTMAEQVVSVCMNGAQKDLYVSGLQPDTDYTLVTYGVTLEGKATVKTQIDTDIAKTSVFTPSEAEFTTEYFKTFDGTEANKAGYFKDYDLTGKAIIVVENTTNAQVDSAFYAFQDGPAFQDGDDVLIDGIKWLKFENNTVTKYGFYAFNYYDSDATIYSLAKDSEGNFGKVGRNTLQAKQDNLSPISELGEILPTEDKSAQTRVFMPLKRELKEVQTVFDVRKK